MTTWVLIIAIVSIGGVSDVKHIQMTGDQCRRAPAEIKPLQHAVGAVCVGPNGEAITFPDVQ